jgi:hypothetical protein
MVHFSHALLGAFLTMSTTPNQRPGSSSSSSTSSGFKSKLLRPSMDPDLGTQAAAGPTGPISGPQTLAQSAGEDCLASMPLGREGYTLLGVGRDDVEVCSNLVMEGWSDGVICN